MGLSGCCSPSQVTSLPPFWTRYCKILGLWDLHDIVPLCLFLQWGNPGSMQPRTKSRCGSHMPISEVHSASVFTRRDGLSRNSAQAYCRIAVEDTGGGIIELAAMAWFAHKQKLRHSRTRGAWPRGNAQVCRSSPGQRQFGGMFARRAPGALLLDYVPPEEPPSTPLGNALRIR